MVTPGIVPPFTEESAIAKVQMAEDLWNTRDPERVVLAYTEDSEWRNRAEFLKGREEIRAFLRRKWARELDYRLKKTLWEFHAQHFTKSRDVDRQVGVFHKTVRPHLLDEFVFHHQPAITPNQSDEDLKTISATAKPLCPRIGAHVPRGRSGIYRTRKIPLF